jgi:hypothetical protein
MSKKEVERIPIIEKVIAKRIKQNHGAKDLNISIRQLQRLVKKYNKKFAVVAKAKDNAHKELILDLNLDVILAKHKKVTIIKNNKDEINIIYKGNNLEYTVFKKQPKANAVLSNKELNIFFR